MTSPIIWQDAVDPYERRILIAHDDESIANQLQSIFQAANFASECTKSITTACQFATSGRFHVIFAAPSLPDGSWRRLIDISKHCDLALIVVLVARSFDMNEWGESLEYGAFDVLDTLLELPNAAEIASRALSTVFLKYLDLPQ